MMPASLPKSWIVGIGIAATVSVAAVTFAVTRHGSEPTGAAPAPTSIDDATDPTANGVRPESGITVTLQRLIDGPPSVNVGHDTSMLVQVTGVAPVTGIELWNGAWLVGSATGDAGDPTWQGTIVWHPAEAGQALLVARATDEQGRSSTSNVLRLVAVEQQSPLPLRRHVTVDGDSPASLSAQFGLGPAAEAVFGPGPPDEPFPAGTDVAIPIVGHLGERPPRDGRSADAPGSIPSPRVELADDGCHVSILPAEHGGEMQLVSALPDGDVFSPVAKLAPGADSFTAIPLGPGTQLFAVESVDDGIRSTTQPVPVTASEDCGGTWSGALRLVHGELLSVPDDIDRAYLYLSTGGAWTRVPAGGQEAIPRRDGRFAMSPAMPDLGTATHVEIEGWGWRGADLVPLGRSTFEPAPGFAPSLIVGQGRRSTLAIAPPEAGHANGTGTEQWTPDPGTEHFEWHSAIPGTTHGLWQVFSVRPPVGSSPLVSGVLLEGEVNGSGGTFPIPLASLFSQPLRVDQVTSLVTAYGAIAGGGGKELVAELPQQPPPPGGSGKAATLAALVASSNLDLLLPPIDDLFIRVVPMVGDHWAGVSTNSVVIHTRAEPLEVNPAVYKAIADSMSDATAHPYTLEATLQPPMAPNPGYANCWTFVKWREDLKDPAYAQQYAYWDSLLEDVGYGTALCPGVCYPWYDQDGISGIKGSVKTIFGGGGCSSGLGLGAAIEELWSGAVELWDTVVAAFNAVKGFIIDVVATLSGCDAIAGAVADEDDAAAFCETMAAVAVNAALIYFGIPPSLPNSEELLAIAKGELSALLVEAANSLGIPCDEIGQLADAADKEEYTCETAASDIVDEVEKQLSALFTEAAAASAGISFPPGAIVKPAPEGQTTPPAITAVLTPTSAAPLVGGKECTALLAVSAAWAPQVSPVTGTGAQLAKSKGLAPAALPGWGGLNWTWGVPDQTYSGPVTALSVQPLPTDSLGYTVTGPQKSATRTYFLSPLPRTPVSAAQFVFSTPMWSHLPYQTLQLHDGATVQAEILSSCTGAYRAVVKLPFGPVEFFPVS